jgi:linoleoyl-CoA desaturase
LDQSGIIRLSIREPLNWYNRYQPFYTWFLYMILLWDFYARTIIPYPKIWKKRVLIPSSVSYWKSIEILSSFLFCVNMFLVVYNLSIKSLLLFTILTSFYGLLISMLFQTSHCVYLIYENSLKHPSAPGIGIDMKPKVDWACDQIIFTNNIIPKNSMWHHIVTHYTSGLNYQIEHHLFPTVNHHSYCDISKILKILVTEEATQNAVYKELKYQFLESYWETMLQHYEYIKLCATTKI